MDPLADYAFGARLGAGTFGETFAATHRPTGRAVAIKRLRVQDAPDWKAIELFEREGRTLAELNHPGIAAYVDAFAVADPERGETFYLVQEHIAGETLQARLTRAGRLDGVAVAALLRELAGVLDYIHARDPVVIHRDLKPSNLMIRANPGDGPRYALIDFGAIQLALPRSDGQAGSTIIGTSGYMPTEQLLGRTVPASDFYALGATAAHALTGVHPSDMAVSRMALDWVPHVAPSAGVTDKLVKAINGLLAPAVEDRVGSGATLAAILDAPTEPPDEVIRRLRADEVARKTPAVWRVLAGVIVAVVALFVAAVVVEAIQREEPARPVSPSVPMGVIIEERHPPSVPAVLTTMPDLARTLGTSDNPVGDALKLTLRAFDGDGFQSAAFLVENTSSEAWSDVKVAAFLVDSDGKTLAISDTELIAGYEGALQPGEIVGKGVHWSKQVAGTARIDVRVISAKREAPIPRLATPLAVTWDTPQPEGVALTFALVGLVDRPDGMGKRRVHLPRVAITNTGDEPIATLRLHKRMVDPAGVVPSLEKTNWAIATGEPSLMPGETRVVTLWTWEDQALTDWSLSIRDVDVGERL